MIIAEGEVAILVRPAGPASLNTARTRLAAVMSAQFHNLGMKIPKQGHASWKAGSQFETVVERQKIRDVMQKEPAQVIVRQSPEASVARVEQVQTLKQSPCVGVHHERLMVFGSKQQNAVGCFLPDPG